ADAAVAPAAERRRDREELVGIDPYRPGLHGAANPPSAFVVAGPDARGQRVDAVIGLFDQAGFIVERHRHQHGPENLFLADPRPIVEAFDDGRTIEITLVVDAAFGTVPAGADASSFRDAQFDVTLDRLAMARGNQRAHLRALVGGIADAQRRSALDEAIDELFVDRRRDEQS